METGNHGDERVQQGANKYDKMLMFWRSPRTFYIKKQWLQNQATLLYTVIYIRKLKINTLPQGRPLLW
jgi:hypothetical protein